MSPLWKLSFIYLLILSVQASLKLGPNSVAVELGPGYITAVSIPKHDNPAVVASVAGDETYRELMDDSIIHEGAKVQKFGEWYLRVGDNLEPTTPNLQDEQSARNVLSTALETISDQIRPKLPQFDIAWVIVPHHFNETLTQLVRDVVSEHDWDPWGVRYNYHVIRFAYNLTSCEGYGLTSSTCDMDEGPHLLLFLNFNELYLEFVVVDTQELAIVFDGKDRQRHLGFRNLASPGEDVDQYWEDISASLQTFTDRMLITGENPRYAKYLRAIVFVGDAPSHAFQRLHDIISDIFPNAEDLVRSSIEPRHLGAVGAARWATFVERLWEIEGDIPAHDEL